MACHIFVLVNVVTTVLTDKENENINLGLVTKFGYNVMRISFSGRGNRKGKALG